MRVRFAPIAGSGTVRGELGTSGVRFSPRVARPRMIVDLCTLVSVHFFHLAARDGTGWDFYAP